MAQVVRPLGVRSKAVKHNNLSLIRHFGNPNETILPFLGSYLPTVDRVSEDMAAKVRYLWQDTLEELATAGEITEDTLNRAWVLVGTEKKPDVPDTIKKLYVKEEAPKKDYDRFLDDVDTDTLTPLEAKKTSDDPVDIDLDIEHDTFDTFASVFKQWPYVTTYQHKLYGPLLVLGQLSGKNRHEHLVYKGCKLNDDSFGKIPAIAEYERKGAKDSTYKIRVLKLRQGVLKFWVNVDDPNRPKGQRDLEELYRYFSVYFPTVRPGEQVNPPGGVTEVDSLTYSAQKNQLQMS